MNNIEELGWKYNKELSLDKYLIYTRDQDKLCIDFEKKKIIFNGAELTFLCLDALLKDIINMLIE